MIDVLKDFYEAISFIDLIYLIITILSLITCYKKGFVLSILSMAKWLLAYVITLILFNNLLQSLFKSQILTLGLVMIGIFAMFIILFRNIKLSLIGVVPNFIAAFFILGIICLLGIPLDMMTITIAAITIGIAVDNSIHYIYRFKEEFSRIKDRKSVV